MIELEWISPSANQAHDGGKEEEGGSVGTNEGAEGDIANVIKNRIPGPK